MKAERRLYLTLTSKDKERLNYANANLEDSLDYIMGADFDISNLSDDDKKLIRDRVERSIRLPKGMLDEYRVEEYRGNVHVNQYN